MKTGTVLAFATPVTGIVKVSAVRIDKTKSAPLTVKATDAAGNTVSYNPIQTTLTKVRTIDVSSAMKSIHPLPRASEPAKLGYVS